jgi:predicted PurR-regulated permease PerM
MLSIFSSKNKVVISPSIVIFTTFFLLGLAFLFHILPILILLFLSFIIMVALNPGVNFFQKKLRLPRALSTLVVYALVIAGFALMLNFLLPPLITELFALFKLINIPVLQDTISDVSLTMAEFSALVERVGSSVTVLVSIVSSTFSGVFTFFTLVIISFYLIQDRPHLYKKAAWFTRQPEHLEQIKSFIDLIEVQLGGWVRGQIILMILIGFATYIGLAVMGVPYALPLALLAGLLEILPNLGPTIAAVPAIIITYLALGPIMAVIVTVFYFLIQILENNVIVPKILKDNVDVNPLIGIVTILIGVQVAGLIGAILAVPTYLILRTIYGVWFKRQVLD